MKRWTILSLLAGAAVFTVLVLHFGVWAIGEAVLRLGWAGFGATVALHLALIVLLGLAWWQVAGFSTDARPRCFIWARLIRDAAGEALPFSQVGGFVLGARAASLCGVPGRVAAATTVVDLTVELVAKLPYMLVGLALLIWVRPHNDLIWPILGGTLLLAALAGLFLAVQARGAAMIERLGTRIADRWHGERSAPAEGMRTTIHDAYARRGDVARGLLLHFVAWVLSGVEVWLPLWFMDEHIGLAAAIVIDSLLVAIRGLAFVVPNAIGVQEGAYVMLCGMFGVPPEVALALSLLRRGRDFAIGIPALLAWQALEGHRAWRSLGSFEVAAGPERSANS
jgi:glycosyltransferase 2 family protein